MIITAHSGCDGTPMNSYEYIRYVLSLPVDAIELDIRMGQNGKLILSHDPLDETKPYVALEEAFDLFSKSFHMINCDLKEYHLEEKLLSTAEKCNIDLSRIILTGSVTDCNSFVSYHPGIKVFVNAEELIPGFYEKINVFNNESLKKDLVNRCIDAGYNVLNIDYHFLDYSMNEICNNNRILLSLWTVDDPEFLRTLNCHNVTTNRVETALRIIGRL